MTKEALADKTNYGDNKKIDELMALFEMHNLIPKLSPSEHAFANSLAVLVTSLEWGGNKRHLFEALPYLKSREIDLLDILNTMANLGFSSHNMLINLSEIDERLMPCLFIPNSKRNLAPLVLLGKKDGIITAFHSTKKETIELQQTKKIEGNAYFFEKINPEEIEERKQTERASGISWFKSLFSRFKPIMQEIIISSLLINTFSLAMPLFSMLVYNGVIGTGSVATLNQIIIGVAIAVMAESVLRIFRLRSVVWLGVRLDNIVSNTIFERLLLMKASYTEGASISAQISRVRTFESIRKFFTGPLFGVVVELPFTIVLLFAIWLIAGPLVYIPIVVVVLFLLLLSYYKCKIRVAMRSSARASSDRQQFGMETFIKMNSLHHNGMSRQWWNQFKEKTAKSSAASFESNMISSIIESAAHCISIMSGVAIVCFGTHLIWDGSITIGALVATMILVWRILSPLQTLCSMLPRVEQLQDSIAQINRLVNIDIERQPTVLKKPIENLNGDIKLHNLGLRYGKEVEPLFVGLDIEVTKGEVIAITGINGSGKSSILKLINGLYQAQTGTIRIDGANIKQMERIELRNYIAYLPQTPNFFEGTIKENLLLANPIATEADLHAALKEANALADIKTLEKGLNTIIYNDNISLSAGFSHTLNLARVLLKKASNILLLDEMPNSALNGPTGNVYKNILINAKGKKTVFFISQRNDFIKLADRVILLRPGDKPLIMTSSEFINKYGQ